MAIHKIKTSFTAGELSPKMFGRPDFAKYDGGAAKLENFLVHRIGGISNRPGFLYIDKAGGDGTVRARLLPFRYNIEQNYVVEVSAWGFRFYYGDECVADVEMALYAEDELEDIKFTQSADVMFLFHPNHPVTTVTRTGADSFTVNASETQFPVGPFEDEFGNDAGVTVTPSATGGALTLTVSSTSIEGEFKYRRKIKLTKRVPAYYKNVNPKTGESVVKVVPGASVHVESFGFWNGTWYLQKLNRDNNAWENVRAQYGNRSNNVTFSYENKSDAIESYRLYSTDFDNSHHEGEATGQTGTVAIQAFGGEYSGIAYITSTSPVHSGSGFYVYATTDNGGKEFYDAEAYTRFSFGAWYEGNFPVCGGFFEDRLCVAATKKQPQTVWMSCQGDYFNFDNMKSEDYEAVTATLSGQELNGIKAMVAFSELLLLTAGGEYKITGNGRAVSPSNCVAQAQEYCGVNNVNPALIGGRIVYVQNQGSIVRDLAYSYDVDKYTGGELSLLAEHLIRRFKITAMAYQQVPDSVVWMVRDDGVLLGLTYIKEQDVYAWHEHTTDGRFVDVCCIAGENYDQVWCVIKRTVNGQERFYVERMPFRELYDTPEEQFFVDAGFAYGFGHSDDPDFPKINYVDCLQYLEGKTVSILADGNVLPQQVVVSGTVALGNMYRTVVVGLPYKSTMLSMPIDLSGGDGSYLARKMTVRQLSVFFERSRGGLFGLETEDDDGVVHSGLDELKWRSNERYGTAVELFTGKKKLSVPKATWGKTVQVRVEQDDPLPMSVLALIPEVVPGG